MQLYRILGESWGAKNLYCVDLEREIEKDEVNWLSDRKSEDTWLYGLSVLHFTSEEKRLEFLIMFGGKDESL